MISLAKDGSLSSRRRALGYIYDKQLVPLCLTRHLIAMPTAVVVTPSHALCGDG